LATILDMADAWEDLAAVMPDIGTVDVDGCRQWQHKGSPTEQLLRIWGSKGYSVLQLYKALALAKHVRAMGVIRDLVDKKFHRLEVDCVTGHSSLSNDTSSRHQGSAVAGSRPSELSARSSFGSSKPRLSSSTSASGSTSTESNNALVASLQNTPAVKYEDLILATDNFDQKNHIGRGGYGVVYKGIWKSLPVAVKRIESKQDRGSEHEKEQLRQSLQELRTLTKHRHDHILPLYGYSLDGPVPCLIYQFMANGSLEDRILCRKGVQPLSWPQRLSIARGTALALVYLHSNVIIHGDVKSANILLDSHLVPKLGDFGLSRIGQIEMDDQISPLVASHIKGTLAYLPPEFIASKIISTKMDVYSFGVVMLEIATGSRAYVDSRQPHSLVEFSTQASEGVDALGLCELSDRRSPCCTDEDRRYFQCLFTMGLRCSQKNRDDRPIFAQIVEDLDIV